MPPTHWGLCEQMVHEAIERGNNAAEDLETAFDRFPWDWRGLINCMHAISLHKPRISHLRFGTQLSKLPLNLLTHVSSGLTIVAPHLKCLKFDSLVDDDVLEEPHSRENVELACILRNFFHAASNLTVLSSSACMPRSLWWATFGRCSWPQVTVLKLFDQVASVEALKAIFLQHKDTLRDLTLRNIHLHAEEAANETWEDVGKACSGMLKLRCLELSLLYLNDGSGRLFLFKDGMLNIGREMMSQVPDEKLMTHFVWHNPEDDEDGVTFLDRDRD